ncbi:PKD domain-containing protein [Jonesia quinghaiensis]|uniref:PKD domain-containing protein n=1 Tax=Jonesia quinghaiensis TaxID=262806 RepID=UPI0003F69C26|nr:zinc transporter [Jonesia quinghaiensis]
MAPVLECTLPDGSVAQTTPATGRQPVVVTVREFRELPLKGSGITIEPDREDYVINLPVIMLTDPAPQILQTNLLGTNVQVKATPTSYTWNWGDGTQPLTTSDPGRPYPDHTVHHTYTSLDTFTITLETTWSGQFSIDNGSTWTSIDGTVTTTNTSSPVTVLEYVPLLVPDS